MRKKIFAFVIIACMTFVFAACGSTDTPDAATTESGSASASQGSESSAAADWKGLTLKFVSNYTAESSGAAVINHWIKRVEEVTDGKIKTTFYPQDTLVKSAEQFQAVLNGVADIALTDPGFNPEYWPVSSGYAIPGLIIDNSSVSTYVADEFITTADFPEFDQVKMLFGFGLNTPGFMGKKPITKLEDFKGLQIRTTGFTKLPVEGLGATAVGMPAPEVYEALLKGTVDETIMGLNSLLDWNLNEVISYCIQVPGISNIFHYCCMNNDVWNSIPKEYQDAIEKVNDECVALAAPIYSGVTEEGLVIAAEKGVECTVISEEEDNRILEALKPVRDKWISDVDAQGLDGQAAWDLYVSLANKYNAEYGDGSVNE
jgi:TRAP-type C4-dicarboxylate transport system substrate-binding protein